MADDEVKPVFEIRDGTLFLMNPHIVDKENALAISIAKWEFIVAEFKKNDTELEHLGGSNSCALCRMYNYPGQQWERRCQGCPIYDATEQVACGGTPNDYLEAAMEEGKSNKILAVLAEAELAFLRSLNR